MERRKKFLQLSMHLPREAISNFALFLTSLTHSTNLIFATEELVSVEMGRTGVTISRGISIRASRVHRGCGRVLERRSRVENKKKRKMAQPVVSRCLIGVARLSLAVLLVSRPFRCIPPRFETNVPLLRSHALRDTRGVFSVFSFFTDSIHGRKSLRFAKLFQLSIRFFLQVMQLWVQRQNSIKLIRDAFIRVSEDNQSA